MGAPADVTHAHPRQLGDTSKRQRQTCLRPAGNGCQGSSGPGKSARTMHVWGRSVRVHVGGCFGCC